MKLFIPTKLPRRVILASTLAVIAAAGPIAVYGGSSAGAATSGKVYQLKISTDLANGASTYNSLYIAAMKAVTKATKGKVQVTVYTANSLYTTQNLALSAASLGQISGVITNGAQAESIIPAEDATNLPFLAPTIQDYFKLFSTGTAWFKEANSEAAKHGLVIVPVPTSSPGTLGFAMNTANPVSSLTKINGLKVRSPGPGVLADTLKALGAEPVTLSTTEIATGMSSGTVQAASGVAASLMATQLKGIANGYFSTGTMTIGAYQLFFSKQVWNGLPAKYQKAIVTTVSKALNKWTNQINTAGNASFKALKAQGDWVTQLPASEVKAYTKKFSKSIWPIFKQQDAASYNALLKSRTQLKLS